MIDSAILADTSAGRRSALTLARGPNHLGRFRRPTMATGERITRTQAIATGAKHYWSGVPCRRGHDSPRRVRDSYCVECALLSSRKRDERLYKTHRPRFATFEERFWSFVDRSGDPDACWLWTGYLTTSGYGEISVANRRRWSHRIAWELLRGPIPPGIEVCHNCPDGDNPACCNPAHLFLGTHADNMRDMWAKGRGRSGLAEAAKTHCPHRHPYSPENTYIAKNPNGNPRRLCIACRDERSRRVRSS